RIVNLERTNIRYFEGSEIKDGIDLATIDASFISLRIIIPAVLRLVKKNDAIMLALIKPQFEAGRDEIEKHGVIRNPEVHEMVIEGIKKFCAELGLTVMGVCESPLIGPKGN